MTTETLTFTAMAALALLDYERERQGKRTDLKREDLRADELRLA